MNSSTFLAPPSGNGSPRVVGHRGDPERYPHNSLAGIISGLGAVGAVEIDVRLTADGHLILSHDAELAGRPVASTAWSEFADLDGERPCLLDEAISIPGRLDIEIKNLPGEPGFDPTGRLALMAASRARAADIVTSFYWPDLDLIRSRRPEVSTGLLVAEGGPARDAVAYAVDGGHAAVIAHDSLIDENMLVASAEAGIPVVAWTVNDEERSIELSRAGVAAIITDRPHVIASALGDPGE